MSDTLYRLTNLIHKNLTISTRDNFLLKGEFAEHEKIVEECQGDYVLSRSPIVSPYGQIFLSDNIETLLDHAKLYNEDGFIS